MKKLFAWLLILCLLPALAGCGDQVIGAANDGSTGAGGSEEPVITLQGDTASFPGGGVSVKDGVITVSAAGDYIVRGTLNNGRIVINTGETRGNVSLTLDGADIHCDNDAAIYVAQAKNADLILAPGSVNRVSSGFEADLAAYQETNAGAAIYAEDDLDIKGEGSLEIFGYLNNGITCKDDLDIQGGTISVVAANNGVRASESVCITAGSLSVQAGNDGVKSTSAQKEGKGWVEISGGEVSVNCGGDGISAETELTVSGGVVRVMATGDPAAVSCKGLKAKTGLTVSGGEVHVLSSDHALRSSAGITLSGGVLELESTEGKAVKAETELTVIDGSVTARAQDDGLAAELALSIQGGSLNVTAGGDGLKAGSKGTGFGEAVGTVAISGGSTFVSAYGDPIDAKAGATVTGGTVLASGISKRIKGFEAGGQPFLACSLTGAGSSPLAVKDGAGAELASMTAVYGYNTVLFSAPELSAGTTYTVQGGAGSVDAAA